MPNLNLNDTFENVTKSIRDGGDGLRTILCHRYNYELFVHGSIPRLGIPGTRFTDGSRGVVMGSSTAFPVAMAHGATRDIDLERRIGDAIGREAKAQGANYFAGVCVNLPRHPAWGRIQETYGENPLMLGESGLALTKGVDEDVLHEVYLPHFRRIVEGGVASVMSAYNLVNGKWADQNGNLLTDILRGKWGYEGFVLSDFIFGLRDPVTSPRNGLDIEAPFIQQRALEFGQALETGQLDLADVDRSCVRSLSKELEFAARNEHSQPDTSVVFSVL
ncbi:glycoside hydrolase superfamily [Penicillium concentricum]|uniref:beta-glucosidase n=1 Tax=Penicillium concentricum TaxID=293559 RepID=A0A9W9VB94_9EURO|nr:glycoside hydrolase superfamily [Penicillium concentricum]KAJ5375773.1 glycoside hydrolase superfamily [Penicillium concentricum]